MVIDEKAVFLAALALPDAKERESYFQEACSGHPELLGRLRELLSAHDESQGPLDRPPEAQGSTADAAQTEIPGAAIGPYKLIELIGEGGMGTVFLAQQIQPVKRLVALKVIKAGMDSRQVLARFEAERQALAMMDHPNIAKVLDAGTTSEGRPYFVMEFVKGVLITKHCDERKLTPHERLELFLPVCHAIQHAHQKGIIHRDIKPSNVIVTLYDGKPVPKVIDFGVAKAAGQPLTERTLVTGLGAVVGTPEYMSPEQAELNQLDIDTRSDIYSLGVLLYELLTGTTPLTRKRLQEAAFLEVLRFVREEEAQRPSTRLSTTDELPSIAANRGTEPARLSRLVRGELDWIVMKCLEKDRTRRYETANGFAMDLQRYLADEPVQACPPSAAYRFRKFAHRQRATLTTVALVAVVLLVGSVVSTWQAIRAGGAEKLAAAGMQAEAEARHAADDARRLAQRGLFDAKLDQARARRASGQVGARAECLKALAEAAELAKTLDLDADLQLILRNELIACLALHDIRLVQEWGGFPDGSRRVAFDAGFKSYAIGDVNGTVRVLSVADQSELARLESPGERNSLTMIRFSPTGRFLAVRHRPPNGSRIELWDVVQRRMVSRVAGAEDLDFSPDGHHVAVVEGNGTIQLYELASDEPTLSLAPQLPRSGNRYVKFNCCGTWVAVWNTEGSEVEVWSVGLKKRLWHFALPLLDDDLGRRVTQKHHVVAWHPHKPIIAVGSHRQIYIWDLMAEKVIDVLKGHQSGVVELAFSPTGDLLVSSSWDGTTRLWDPRGGQNSWTLPGRTAPAIRADGRELAIRNGPRLEILKIEESPEYRPLYFQGESTLTEMVDIDPEESLLVSAGEQGLRLWDVETGKEVDWLRIGLTNSVSFTPDGRQMLTAGAAGVFRWPIRRSAQSALLSQGPPEKLLIDPIGASSYLALSHDRDTLLVSDGRQAAVHSLGSGTLKCRLAEAGNLFRPTVSPDGRWIAAGAWHGSDTRVWDATSGQCVRRFPLGFAGSSRASFSSNGRRLIISNGSDYRLIEVDTWQELLRLPCDLVDVVPGPAAFSPDDRLLAIARTPQVVKLVDPVNGKEVATLTVPRVAVLSWLCFSADGSRLAAGTEDDVIHLWDLRGVRKRLAELNLDWDALPFTPNGTPRPLVRVGSHLGELAPVRQKVALCRRLLAANHRDTQALNNLAWAYVAGPADLRDPKAALTLAEQAVQLDPKRDYLNTLGVVYYRLGRYRDAIDTLNRAIAGTKGVVPAEDNLFLAMCHHRLGDREKAQKAFADALYWMEKNPREDELLAFRAEAEELLNSNSKDP